MGVVGLGIVGWVVIDLGIISLGVMALKDVVLGLGDMEKMFDLLKVLR